MSTMNEMVKEIVGFIDNNHPTLVSHTDPVEVAPNVYRVNFFYTNSPGEVEVEFRVKQ